MKKVILLSLSILLISLAYSFAEVPCKINYQGRLIKDNVPVDGTKTMKFSIYDSAVGPTLLWTSEDVSVTVHNGLFRYVIGSGGTDLSSINWTAGQALYLEVVIDGETLTPREELSAYPYAINSQNSHLLEGEAKEYFLNTSVETQTKDGGLNIMGNVGIGTTSPGANYKLHVDGGSDASAIGVYSETTGDLGIGVRGTATGDGGTGVRGTATGFGGIGVRGRSIDPSSGRAVYGSAYGGVGGWFSSDTGYGLIVESGNVGIGTTSPGEKFTVAGTIESTTGGVKFPDGTLQTTATGSFIPADINTMGWGNDSAGSVEFPNGLIVKWGIQGIGAPTTVTFSTPFPQACFQVIGVQANSSDYHTNVRIDTITKTSFNSYVKPMRWFAIGR